MKKDAYEKAIFRRKRKFSTFLSTVLNMLLVNRKFKKNSENVRAIRTKCLSKEFMKENFENPRQKVFTWKEKRVTHKKHT